MSAEGRNKYRRRFQRLFSTKQKKANAQIAGKSTQQGITALRDPDGRLVTSQQGMLDLAHDIFQRQAARPSAPDSLATPWDVAGLDTFRLIAEALEADESSFDFRARMADRGRFDRLV